MLGKLLKYDFTSIARGLLPLYLLIIGSSAILSMMLRIDMDGLSRLAFFITLPVALSVGANIATVVLLVKRFAGGLLGSEGYLYFALPVKTSEHIASKLINAVIWGILQSVVMGVSALLIALVVSETGLSDFIEELEVLGRDFLQSDPQRWLMIGKILLLVLLNFVELVCFIYLCCSIGHLFSNHRMLWAVVAYIAIGSARGQLLLPLYNLGMRDSALIGMVNYIMPIVLSAISLIGTWYILDRKLNLE